MPFHLNPETRHKGGRRKGDKNKRTIELEFAQKQLQQAVFQNLKPMMVAQVQAAKGESYVYRVDRDDEGKETHVLLTEGKEIGEALDAISAGEFDNNYFYISTKPANTQAFKELLDRGFGKAKETKDLNVNVTVSLSDIARRALERKNKQNDLPVMGGRVLDV